MTARVSMLLKLRASPDMLPFSLCNKKRLAIRHMNRSFFPTTISIPSYDIGNFVGLRTYQHPLVCIYVYMYASGHVSMYVCTYRFMCVNECMYIYIQSAQEECAILRESVPYVKLYRYNPKHLYSKLNSYVITLYYRLRY